MNSSRLLGKHVPKKKEKGENTGNLNATCIQTSPNTLVNAQMNEKLSSEFKAPSPDNMSQFSFKTIGILLGMR